MVQHINVDYTNSLIWDNTRLIKVKQIVCEMRPKLYGQTQFLLIGPLDGILQQQFCFISSSVPEEFIYICIYKNSCILTVINKYFKKYISIFIDIIYSFSKILCI